MGMPTPHSELILSAFNVAFSVDEMGNVRVTFIKPTGEAITAAFERLQFQVFLKGANEVGQRMHHAE